MFELAVLLIYFTFKFHLQKSHASLYHFFPFLSTFVNANHKFFQINLFGTCSFINTKFQFIDYRLCTYRTCFLSLLRAYKRRQLMSYFHSPGDSIIRPPSFIVSPFFQRQNDSRYVLEPTNFSTRGTLPARFVKSRFIYMRATSASITEITDKYNAK